MLNRHGKFTRILVLSHLDVVVDGPRAVHGAAGAATLLQPHQLLLDDGRR